MWFFHNIHRLILAITLLITGQLAWAQETIANKTYLVEIDGAIGPVTQELIIRSIDNAQDEGIEMLILQMNTPGGLDHSTRKIIAEILDSRVAVITYVAPQGSRAASAGTYILYASHLAAMAPATNIGAATPVQFGQLPSFPSEPSTEKDGEAEKGQPAQSTMDKKIINDATAYIKGLAKLRGRNEEWAERAVREAATLTAEEALEMQVIDIIAENLTDLLKQLDGRQVDVKGQTLALNTDSMIIEHIKPDWRSRALGIITNPNIAYILLLIGIYGLVIEFSNPGFILPGVIGTISLLLALYAFQILPINYAGLALVGIGLAFMVSEVFITSGGILGIGGVVAFTIGSVILFDDEYLAVSIPLIGGTSIVAAGFMLWILNRFAALRHKQVVSGAEYLVGRTGYVVSDFSGRGRVKIDGESWLAETRIPVTAGQEIRVHAIDRLVLKIEPLQANSKED
ncbi:MAG: nodulation protein NfeD [Gammaproteobacteria bacterium]|nr:MAG: nodulation protein NfeD [Gammaproteobacteria bacterium]